MIAEIHQLKPKAGPTTWMCSACGIDAACNCGAPLMSKAARIREALSADPEKPNRQIAREIGAQPKDVRRERNKARGSMDPQSIEEDEFDPDVAIEQTKQVFLLGAHEAMRVAEYHGPTDDEIIETARDAAAAWCRLVSKLTGETI